MGNKNVITFCSCKPSQKNSIEAHENYCLYEKSVEVLDELQDTISRDRKVNKLWQLGLFERKRSIQ